MSDEQKEQSAKVMAAAMQEKSDLFDELCKRRWEAGAEEYGPFTFLGNDIIRMMAEEMADIANYNRMQFIKIMLLAEMLEDELADKADPEGNITIGVKSFKGTGEGWNK